MEKRHVDRLRRKLKAALVGKTIPGLHIPEDYKFMDPELIELLKSKLSGPSAVPE